MDLDTTGIRNITAASKCVMPFEPQIDPALLENNDTTIAQNPVTNDGQQPQDSGGYIDDTEMQVLIANGFPNAIPVNGPQDGPPRYLVTAAAIQFLSNQAGNISTVNNALENIENSSTKKKNKSSRKRKSIEVAVPRRSGRVRENDKDQQRQTRSQKQVEVAKKR